MQAYIPGIHPGRPGNAFFASGGDLLQKNAQFIFGLIGAAGTLAMLPFYMEGAL